MLTRGRPATGSSRAGNSTADGGHSWRICSFCEIVSRSSRKKGPESALAYVSSPARTSRAAHANPVERDGSNGAGDGTATGFRRRLTAVYERGEYRFTPLGGHRQPSH